MNNWAQIAGVSSYIIFLFLHKNICLGNLIEAPQHMFSWKYIKYVSTFWLKKVYFISGTVLKYETKYPPELTWSPQMNQNVGGCSCLSLVIKAPHMGSVWKLIFASFAAKHSSRVLNGISSSKIHVKWTLVIFVCLCWGFTAKSTQWGHVERGQFT